MSVSMGGWRPLVLPVLLLLLLAACRESATPATVAPASAAASTTPSVASPTAPVVGEVDASPTLAHVDAMRLPEVPPPASAACAAKTAGGGAPRSLAVHRWTDASGVVHYSDQSPPAAVSDHRVLEVGGLPSIAVQASGHDVNLPDQLQQRAVADALGVQRVLRDVLGIGALSGLTLRIVFVRSLEAYGRLIGDPALASSAGAYSTANRTIFVRMQGSDEAQFAVLRHEITHALVHESIGNLPTPLNEGLAEYFGRYRVSGLGGQIDVAADRAALRSAAPADAAESLVDLLARDGRDFYVDSGNAGARERRYLQAYALVALLMRSAEGRASLGAVLVAEQAEPCIPVAAEDVLQRRYPGGLAALAEAWAALMRDPPDGIQAY